MRLKNPGTLPKRLIGYPRTDEWYRIFDKFAERDEEFAEILDYGYNDPFEAIVAGTQALAGREIISGYLGAFRLDVLQGRLFIIRR